MNDNKNKIWLIFLFAFAIRLVGIGHSFPLILHPDEPTVVRSALEIRFYPNPGHFDWPHLYIYFNYIIYMVFAKIRDLMVLYGFKNPVSAFAPIIFDDNLIFYAITRFFSMLFGALTVFPVYLTAKKLFGSKAALFTSLIFAMLPFHVWHSQYSLIDVPMTFFVAVVLLLSVEILYSNSIKNYILAGVFVGLAASTKYNGGLSAIFVALAHFNRIFLRKEKIYTFSNLVNPALSTIFSIVFFIIGTPYAVLDFKTFTLTDGPKGALWQFANVGKVDLVTHLEQFFKALTYGLGKDMGVTPIICFWIVLFVFIAHMIKKNKKVFGNEFWLLFVSLISFIYYVSGFEKDRSHYFFIVYPVFIIFSIGYFYKIVDSLLIRSRIIQFIFVVVFIIPFTLMLRNDVIRLNKDTRVILNDYILTNSKFNYKFEDRELKRWLGYKENMGYTTLYVVNGDNNIKQITNRRILLFIDNKLRDGPSIAVYE